MRSASPLARGWWLAAYLFLVGGVSQILLGNGLLALARRSAARGSGTNAARGQLALWNVGTVTIAIADLKEVPGAVLTGSAALFGALVLFGLGLRRVHVTALHPARGSLRGYAVLLGFLAASVVIGAALAGALPGG